MLITIHPDNPNPRAIAQVVGILKKGGVVIYPTDTIYGIGCDIKNSKAIERVCQIKQIKPEKANLSFICNDLSNLSDYVKPIDTPTFRLLKKALPGAFTFIFNANNNVPRLLCSNKKTVGIRVPDNLIAQAIVREFGSPILSTSVGRDAQTNDFYTDPLDLQEVYGHLVDAVVDGGYGSLDASTVVDCTNGGFEIIRQGCGDLEAYM